MTPTDADRERAREIADGAAKPSRDTSYVIHEDHRRRLIDNIAAAIAAARADALEQAAQYVQRLTEEQSTIRRHQVAVAIRAIKEPGHGK